MSLYTQLIRPLAFLADPEQVHESAMGLIRRGVFKTREFHDSILEQELFGVKFPNPIGLAAGFDKNAVALDHWRQLGFGFVEAGTITYESQPGNDRPRMFRLPDDHALINRMGFNNDGARAVATRLATARAGIPVGVNLGKSRIAPVEAAARDYRESFRLLHNFGDYFVVNVSSPNTPGLRSLQDRAPLLEILGEMRTVDDTRPIFIKVAPDLELSALDEVIEVAQEACVTGLIATNTTVSREGLTRDPEEPGGLSGAPLRERSDAMLAHIALHADPSLTLIGVGGIFTGEDLYRKIRLGAHLAQIYTGWIYGGPHSIPDMLESLVGLLHRDGFTSLAAARGSLLRR